MTQTRTLADAILKDVYGDGGIIEMATERDPIIAMIKRDTSAFGRKFVLPIQFARNQSLSGTFATGQAVGGYNRYEAWEITPQEYFAFAKINRTLLKTALKDGEQAFANALLQETKGTTDALADELCFQLYGAGTGARGQISATSTVASTAITLATIQDAVYFEVGMNVITDADPGTGSITNTGAAVLTKVNRNTGVLTTTGNWSTLITTAAVNDYIFRTGDFGLGLKGIKAWLPDSDPAATAFFGVARDVDPQRLGGNRNGALGKTIEEALIDMAMDIGATAGGRPDVVVLNLKRWAQLEKELMVRGTRPLNEKIGNTGFQTLQLTGPTGVIKVYGSPYCPYNRGYVLQLDTWKLLSAGSVPEMFDDDGNDILRVYNANTYEARFGWIGEIGCEAPGKNGVVKFDVAPT